MVKWWDRFWGAAWMVGSVWVAYRTARWMAASAAPADLGGLRYGLIAAAGLFGLLLGAFCLSLLIIGITSGFEWLLARVGHPLRPAQAAPDAPLAAIADGPGPATDTPTSAEPLAEARSSSWS